MKNIKPAGVKVQITVPKDIYEIVKQDIEKNFMTTTSWFMKAIHAQLANKPKKVIDLDS